MKSRCGDSLMDASTPAGNKKPCDTSSALHRVGSSSGLAESAETGSTWSKEDISPGKGSSHGF